MKLFVTGGAGFIGSNFIRHVLAVRPDWHVINYDKLTYAGNLANLQDVAGDSRYSFVRGDICDAKAVAASMRGCEAVAHFAAESHVDRSIYDPAPVVDTNVTGTFVLLKAANELAVRRFLHGSVSTKVTSHAHCAVLVAHAKPSVAPEMAQVERELAAV